MGSHFSDDFDRAAHRAEFRGAHRASGSAIPWIMALIGVIVLAPLAGITTGVLMGAPSARSSTGSVTSPVQTSSDADTSSGRSEQSESSGRAEQGSQEVGQESEGAAGENGPNSGRGVERGSTPGASSGSQDPSAQVNTAVEVTLFDASANASGASSQEVLESAGYRSVAVEAYSYPLPVDATVYYFSENSRSTAEDIAQRLSIDSVVQDPSTVDSDQRIKVVLR